MSQAFEAFCYDGSLADPVRIVFPLECVPLVVYEFDREFRPIALGGIASYVITGGFIVRAFPKCCTGDEVW